MATTRPRKNHQSRVDWWRVQFQRQRNANLSVTDLCRQIGVSVTTLYYWKKRVDEAPPDARGVAPAIPASRHAAMAPNFVFVSIVDPGAGTQLEIELANSCVLRLKGVIDPALLQAAITAVGELDGSRQGAH